MQIKREYLSSAYDFWYAVSNNLKESGTFQIIHFSPFLRK